MRFVGGLSGRSNFLGSGDYHSGVRYGCVPVVGVIGEVWDSALAVLLVAFVGGVDVGVNAELKVRECRIAAAYVAQQMTYIVGSLVFGFVGFQECLHGEFEGVLCLLSYDDVDHAGFSQPFKGVEMGFGVEHVVVEGFQSNSCSVSSSSYSCREYSSGSGTMMPSLTALVSSEFVYRLWCLNSWGVRQISCTGTCWS